MFHVHVIVINKNEALAFPNTKRARMRDWHKGFPLKKLVSVFLSLSFAVTCSLQSVDKK